MKHTPDELLEIVYRYYPREDGADDPLDRAHGKGAEEHERLVDARRHAAADERWPAMQRRIAERFPNLLANQSLHLQAGSADACYSFTITLPEFTLWFRVSFLAPYYLVYSSRLIGVAKQIEGFNVAVRGMQFYLPRSAAGLELLPGLSEERMKSATVEREALTFDLSPEEQPYAAWITREVESTFDCERLPPEIGQVLVPEVTVNMRGATLYDCLFSDDHPWTKLAPSGEMIREEIDASSLPEQLLAVLTVLASFYHIGLALAQPEVQSAYWRASTDGVLHKEELLQALAKMRSRVESAATLRAMAAARELEALIAAWSGEGAPPAAMVDWAVSFLISPELTAEARGEPTPERS